MISHYFQKSTERYFPCMMHGWNAYANDNQKSRSLIIYDEASDYTPEMFNCKPLSLYKVTFYGHELFSGTKQSCWIWMVNRYGHTPAYELMKQGYLIEKVMEGYDGNAT